ncbi:hypothetical protein [Bacillus halotolerans]|uniref:hypothetical protein n=1 Tax=Bacillus halotolerans TaxID=260554 RepID=UPI0020C43EF1|nr:hypothetical protein [Bacillus halotolerans]UTL73876.1 hypothetical protein NLV76_06500 [Bacillus halotolerans]
MNNIDRLSERLNKKYKNQLLTLKIMRKLRDDLIQLENRFADIFEVSDNRVEFRIDNKKNEVFYFNLNNSPAEFRVLTVKGVPHLQVIDPDTELVHVVFQINSSEELTPLLSNDNPCNYSIHINDLVDFVVGVACFDHDFKNKEAVIR